VAPIQDFSGRCSHQSAPTAPALGLGEVPISRVDGFELAAVDRNARFAEQLKAAPQHHELTADLADGFAIVLAEVGYCLEVRHQAAGQPNQLDVALALA
jgi:hypothetical protein